MEKGAELARDCPVRNAKPYLLRATDFDAKQPAVGYYLRTHALNIVMAAPRDSNTKVFLMTLLDALEKDKASIPDLASHDGRMIVTKTALMLFTLADDMERATATANEKAVKLFFTASLLFEATAQFNEGSMDPVAAEKCKYARVVAGLMKKSLETGAPYVSPNGGKEAAELAAMPTPGEETNGFASAPPPPAAFGAPSNTTTPTPSAYPPPPPPAANACHQTQPPAQHQAQAEYPAAPTQPPATPSQPLAYPQHPSEAYQQPPPQAYQQPPPQAYQQPPPQAYQQPPPPAPAPVQPAAPPPPPAAPATMQAPASRGGAKAKTDRVILAEKHARQAIAALQFFDEPTARAQLMDAIAALDRM